MSYLLFPKNGSVDAGSLFFAFLSQPLSLFHRKKSTSLTMVYCSGVENQLYTRGQLQISRLLWEQEWVQGMGSNSLFTSGVPQTFAFNNMEGEINRASSQEIFLNFRSLRCLAYNSEAFQCITILKLLYLFIYISKLSQHLYQFLNNAELCFTPNNVIFSHIPLCILKPTVKIPTHFTKRCVSNNLLYVFNYDSWGSTLHVMLCWSIAYW